MRSRWIWQLLLTLGAAAACSGTTEIRQGRPDGTGAPDASVRDSDAASGGAASTAGGAGTGAASASDATSGGATASGGVASTDSGEGGATADGGSTSIAGSSSGGVATGGGAGAGGASTGGVVGAGGADDAGTTADAARSCTVDRECPRPPTPCAVARCSHGSCIAANAKAGTVIPDVPGDCHDAICDGLGGVASRPLDENDVPVLEDPCLAGTCDKAGIAGVANLAVGTPCRLGGGGKLCDGSGNCVECLKQGDCAAGLYCEKNHSCGTTPCTDVACGGGCTPCDLGGKCVTDFDCLSFACDTAAHVCVAKSCGDNHQDGNETDVDCGGGGGCPPCPVGKKCDVYYDCASGFCDAVLRQCVTAADGCTDHAPDGSETDTDCGGPVCPPCGSGMFCKSTADCKPGLTCSGSPQACY